MRRSDATRVAPSQIRCAAEVCTPSSTPTWGVSVEPHGVYGNSNPSGVNLQEALGWHGVVITNSGSVPAIDVVKRRVGFQLQLCVNSLRGKEGELPLVFALTS